MNYTVITTLYFRNDSFKIVKDTDGWYLAVDTKYLDRNGRVTRKLNGLQMHAAKSFDECINKTKFAVKVDELVAQGINQFVANVMVSTGKKREEVETKEFMELIKNLEK